MFKDKCTTSLLHTLVLLWSGPGQTHFPHTPHSATIKRVGHGWVRAYYFETRTIKVFLSLWDKHAIMPPMRIAVCFDGRIVIHDHIPRSNTVRALSLLPHYLTWYALFLVFFYLPSIDLFTSIFSSLFTFCPHKCALCFSHLLELHVHLRFPIPHFAFGRTIPSAALRSKYPFKFQKWNFQQ